MVLPTGVIIGLVVLVALIVIGFIFTRMYVTADSNVAYVRTGMGGIKVIKDGGGLVIAGLQQISSVPLSNMKIEIAREGNQALITKDSMRMDIVGAFYLKVKQDDKSIICAAQTLGERLNNTAKLTEEMQDKFVGALRAAASKLTQNEMHSDREKFIQMVQSNINTDLNKNGIELETFSPTHLDQTNIKYLDENNIYDAEAMRKITEVTNAKKKERNAIEQATAVDIAKRNQEANKEQLDIAQEDEQNTLAQAQTIANKKAEQKAQISIKEAEQTRISEETTIRTEKELEEQRIGANRQLEEKRISNDKDLQEQEIAAKQVLEVREEERKKSVEIAEQDRKIAVAEKSEHESKATSLANIAKADEIKTEEGVTTAGLLAQANRQKEIEIIEATKIAEVDSVGITVAASAELKASTDKAESLDITAKAEASAVVTRAEGAADAEKLATEAAELRYTVEAEGVDKMNEAENKLSDKQVEAKLKGQLIGELSNLIEQSVKPLENIDGIKIVDMGGLGGMNSVANADGSEGSVSMADQVVNAAAKHQIQKPMLDSLLAEVGITSNKSVSDGVAALVTQTITSQS